MNDAPRRSAAVTLLGWLVPIVSSVALLRWLLDKVYASLNFTLSPFEGIPLDGPFQLFNPMRRMAAGQTPGVDFQYFHGLLVPIVHYPLFKWFGGDIFASEISRSIVSPVTYALALFLLGWAVTRRLRLAPVFALFAALLTDLCAPLLVLPMMHPRSLRSTTPLLVFALLLSPLAPLPKAILCGIGAAIAIALGAEHGIGLIAGVAAVQLAMTLVQIRRATLRDWLFVPTLLGSFVAAVPALYWCMGGVAGARGAIRYAFKDVPGDQFWYFGCPPNPFISDWAELLRDPYVYTAILLTVPAFVYCVSQAVRRPTDPAAELHRNRNAIAAMMLFAGALSCISYLGIAAPVYISNLYRILVLVGLLLFVDVATMRDGFAWVREKLSSRDGLAWSASVGLLIVLTADVGAAALDYRDISKIKPYRSHAWNVILDGLKARINERPRPAGQPPSLWSTYSGILESDLGVFAPADDFIIQPLGPKRRRHYVEVFRETKPEFVQTIRRAFVKYEEWLQNTTWPFYEDVLNNYDICETTFHSLLWKRMDAEWKTPTEEWTNVPVTVGASRVTLPVTTSDDPLPIIVVRVRYEIHNPIARLPVFGALPRYLISPQDASTRQAISLPPYAKEHTFPVVPMPGKSPALTFETKTLVPGPEFSVTAIDYRMLPVRRANVMFLEYLPPWIPPEHRDKLSDPK